jgi:hypothetical protein
MFEEVGMAALLVAVSPLATLGILLGMQWYEDRMLGGDGLTQPYSQVPSQVDKQAAQLTASERARAA